MIFGERRDPETTTELQFLRVHRRSARRATAPCHGRFLSKKQIDGTIPTEIGLLTNLTSLRDPPRVPEPGAARD